MTKLPPEEDLEDSSLLEKEIDIDSENSDSSLQDEIEDLERTSEIHRLNNRITILSILIPGVLCAILLFAYLDMRQRVSQIQTEGLSEVQALSDLVDKIATLSDENTRLTDRVSTLEKSTGSIKEDLNRDEQSIKRLAVSKASKKALEKAITKHSEEVGETFSALQKDVAKQKESIEQAAEELRRQLDEAVGTLEALRNDLLEQEKKMAEIGEVMEAVRSKWQKRELVIRHLSEGKVDKEEFDSFLKNEGASYQQARALLEKQIKSLEHKIFRLQKRVNLIGKGDTVPEAESPHAEAKPSAETKKHTPSPVPGQIIEQEITE